MVDLNWYLFLSALLFSIGMFGFFTRRNAVAILMSLELMFNAVNLNLIAFSRFILPSGATGQVFALFVIAIAAAEAVVGVAIIINLYKNFGHTNVDEIDLMKW